MSFNRFGKLLGIYGIVIILQGQAVIAEEKDIQKAPVAMPVGPFEFAPLLEIAESYSDNIFQKNVLQKDSLITQIHAGGQLSLERKLNRYLLTYVLQSSQYHNSPLDDYVDNYVGINTHTEFTSRHRLNVDAKYLNSHYMRGVFLGRDILDPPTQQNEPDQYQNYGGGLTYQYGGQKARGNLELKMGIDDFTFDNNRIRTAQQDRTVINITPGFYFRVMPNTRLLFQIEDMWLNHKDAAEQQYDFLKQRFLTGLTWDYSSITQGTARIGYLRQDYQNANIEDYDGITWDLGLRWQPLTYSKLNLNISRDVNPAVSGNNLRDADRFSLGWTHDWTSRISSKLNGSYESALNSSSLRQDDFVSFGADLHYGVRRWLGMGISYNFRQLQSSSSSFDFDQNIVMLYVTGNPRISDEAKTPWASWY